MLQKALSYLAGMAEKAKEIRQIPTVGIKNKMFLEINGEVKTYDYDVPDRTHKCHTLESFLAWCGSPETVIWFNMNGVTAVLDDAEMRDNTVKLPLTHSPEWDAAMKGAVGKSQKEIIQWIQHHLAAPIEVAAPGLLLSIRQMQFSSNSDGHSHVQNGKESMGKSVNAEATGTTDFPDDITVSVLVWSELDITAQVTLAFNVDCHEATLSLRPLAAEKQSATKEALDLLGHGLAEPKGDSRLYCGSP